MYSLHLASCQNTYVIVKIVHGKFVTTHIGLTQMSNTSKVNWKLSFHKLNACLIMIYLISYIAHGVKRRADALGLLDLVHTKYLDHHIVSIYTNVFYAR